MITVQNTCQMELFEFFFEPARESGIHARASRQYDMFVEIRSDVHSCCLNGLEEHLYRKSVMRVEISGRGKDITCDTWLFDIDKMRLKQTFWCFVAFWSNFDYSTVRKLVADKVGSSRRGTNAYRIAFHQDSRFFSQPFVQFKIVTRKKRSNNPYSNRMWFLTSCSIASPWSHERFQSLLFD